MHIFLFAVGIKKISSNNHIVFYDGAFCIIFSIIFGGLSAYEIVKIKKRKDVRLNEKNYQKNRS